MVTLRLRRIVRRGTLLAVLGLLALGAAVPARAQCVSLTVPGAPYTQNFDTLSNTAGSTTNALTIAGWFMTESGAGARDNEQYAVDTGGSNTGDTYSYGAAASTERALGSVRSGTLTSTFGACFTNNTGGEITSLGILYTGEEWRLGTAGRTDRIDFHYSVDATSLTTGTWTDVNALDFTTPDTATTGAKNGNASAYRTALSSILSGLTVADGATFWIRWMDADATSADDGLAVDDFLLAPNPLWLSVNDVTAIEGNSGTTTFTFTVSLSSAAPVGGVTFDIATADGTATTADNDYVAKSLTGQTIAEGSTTYTFDVTVNGDATVEADQTFFVDVTNVVGTGVSVADGHGIGTITNDDVAPTLSINDVTAIEGDSGPTTFTFTVGLSVPAPVGGVTFDIATADGTATTADNDYVMKSLTGQTIAEGSTTYTFDVTVNGDTTVEPDQTFFVDVTNVVGTGVTALDGHGIGTITNDDFVFTSIHDIQGNGAASPLVGSVVTTRGVVTGVKSNGFFIQEPDATVDADPATSEGILVFTNSAPPVAATVGNLVQVSATVAEYVPSADLFQPPLTELTSPTVSVLSTGNPLPLPVALNATFPDPAGSVDQLERLEGMRVSLASLTVSGPTLGNITEASGVATTTGVFYGVVTGVARPFREPGILADDPPPSGSIPPIPRFDANPEIIRVDSDGQTGAAALDVGAGAVVTGLVGPLDYSFRAYTILPDPATPPSVAGGPTAAAVVESDGVRGHRRLLQPPALLRRRQRPGHRRAGAEHDGLRQPAEEGVSRHPQLPADARHHRRAGGGEPDHSADAGDAHQHGRPRRVADRPAVRGLPRRGQRRGRHRRRLPRQDGRGDGHDTSRGSERGDPGTGRNTLRQRRLLHGTAQRPSAAAPRRRRPLRRGLELPPDGHREPPALFERRQRHRDGLQRLGHRGRPRARQAPGAGRGPRRPGAGSPDRRPRPSASSSSATSTPSTSTTAWWILSASSRGHPHPTTRRRFPATASTSSTPTSEPRRHRSRRSATRTSSTATPSRSTTSSSTSALVDDTTARRVEHPRIGADFPETARNDASTPVRLSDHDPAVAYFAFPP